MKVKKRKLVADDFGYQVREGDAFNLKIGIGFAHLGVTTVDKEKSPIGGNHYEI